MLAGACFDVLFRCLLPVLFNGPHVHNIVSATNGAAYMDDTTRYVCIITIGAGTEKDSIDMRRLLLLWQLDVSPRVQSGLVNPCGDRQAYRAPRRGLHGGLESET